jgi:calcineurin-like phosphoesterase family protein
LVVTGSIFLGYNRLVKNWQETAVPRFGFKAQAARIFGFSQLIKLCCYENIDYHNYNEEEAVKLYISDLHFGHSNVIKFDNRPFSDVDEMDYAMIKLWNSRVQKDDDVYIVGDFCFRNGRTPDWYLKKLSGHKHLVIGNHDGKMLENPKAMQYFETVDKMMHVTDGDKQICLCHFPLAEWNHSHRGSWHIYGHIHNRKEETYEFMKTKERALNAAACINNYTPVSVNELIRNNKLFNEG